MVTERLKRFTIKMPYKGKTTALPAYAIDRQALYDAHNFVYTGKKTLRLMPGWKKFLPDPISTNPIMMIDQLFKSDGTSYFVVADTENLYEYDPVENEFVSKGGTFTGGLQNIFSFDIWPEPQNELLIFTNGVDEVKKYDGAIDVDDLGGLDDAEPGSIVVNTAKCVRSFNDFIVLVHTTEDGDVKPFRVRWCKKGYPEIWKNDENFLGEAGFTDLAETVDWAITAERLNYYLVIYKERSIHLMEYVGSPTVMRFTRLIDGIGIMAPRAVASLGNYHIFVGNDNVYQVSPTSFDPIGDEIKDELFALINPERRDQVTLFLAEETSEIHVCFPSVGSDYNDKFYVYNYVLKNWTGPHDRSSSALGYFQSERDTTIEDLEGSYAEQVGAWDDRVFSSNSPLNMMGDYNGYLYIMQSGIKADEQDIDGDVTFRLDDFDMPELSKRLQKLWLAVEGSVGGNIQVLVGYTENPDVPVVWYGPIEKLLGQRTLEFDMDIVSKYFQLKIAVSGGAPFSLLGMTAGFIPRGSTR